MSKKSIYDASGNVVKVLHVEDPNDFYSTFHLETVEDVEPLINQNKVERELQDDMRFSGEHRNSGMRKVASVPMSVMERSIREDWDENDWKRFLNDPDNAYLRVWQGRI